MYTQKKNKQYNANTKQNKNILYALGCCLGGSTTVDVTSVTSELARHTVALIGIELDINTDQGSAMRTVTLGAMLYTLVYCQWSLIVKAVGGPRYFDQHRPCDCV